ncbi:unnamed protein product [Arabidopsis thaliana]|uniref:Uncharacterized protein n=2 Tax=Arabidopsis thaliana TaxID=3702 RepID=A0A1P8AZZ4_ARATH|nr:uncharacterized protein AT2G10455 [Arabidopsis thaliana]ANM62210.1 hypothetical protein AT2G10455 [Arabidopsis thaliana]VYS52222.1 unnamed protein product [Arabidopsis thaliana]|eukprot:NP_001324385.1 hypothetical protein AT2G10455 [Arabidopsis thaliana]
MVKEKRRIDKCLSIPFAFLCVLKGFQKDHLTGNQSFVNRTHGDVEMYVCFNLVWVRGRRNDGIGRTKDG